MSYQFEGWREPTLGENLERAGVSRRDFLKYCGGLAAIFATGKLAADATWQSAQAEVIAEKLAALTKPNVVWLQLQECTGCMESTLRSGDTTIEALVLNLLSVNYNELLMAAAGDAANKALDDTNAESHILVVNGSVPKENPAFCSMGGRSAEQVLIESAKNADAILAVGACAVWGSVQAAKPNPTGAVGVDQIIKDKPVVNVSGCPPIGEVITATLAYILAHDGNLPQVDAEGRPLFGYEQRIHDSCPRRAHFDAGEYVRVFDDEGARSGWCLYDVGCKGPSTFSPCPIIQWNLHTSWPIGAGHPCIGCTEKDFFDRFTPFYSALPDVKGFGVESTAVAVGLTLVGATAAGVAAHAGLSAVRNAAAKKSAEESEPLQAFGDAERVWLPDPKPVKRTGDTPPTETKDS